MGVVTATVLATAAAVSAATAIDQKKAAKRAQRKQEKANRIEKARAEATRSIERRRSIAGARQAQAANFAAGLSTGLTAGSSPIQGANASIGSDLGTSQSFANASFTSGQQTFDLRQSAAFSRSNANANAAIGNAVAGAVSSAAPFTEGMTFGGGEDN